MDRNEKETFWSIDLSNLSNLIDSMTAHLDSISNFEEKKIDPKKEVDLKSLEKIDLIQN